MNALALHDSLLGASSPPPTATPTPAPTPGTSTLISPNGDVGSAGVTFTWSEATNATYYTLVIYGVGTDSIIFTASYDATATCANNECSVQPGITLAADFFAWLVQAENNGLGEEWSTVGGP
ncbi:MAG: hypothetical protein AAF702_23860 [Chloroflexota bacterium]